MAEDGVFDSLYKWPGSMDLMAGHAWVADLKVCKFDARVALEGSKFQVLTVLGNKE